MLESRILLLHDSPKATRSVVGSIFGFPKPHLGMNYNALKGRSQSLLKIRAVHHVPDSSELLSQTSQGFKPTVYSRNNAFPRRVLK